MDSTPHASGLTAPAPISTFEDFWAEHYAARWSAERAAEEQQRDEAFAGCTHTVCGLELRGMTAHDLLLLHGCANPFIVGGLLTPAAVAQFVAVLVEPAPSGWWARRRFFRHLARYPYPAAVSEIKSYVARMLGTPVERADSPDTPSEEPAEPLNLNFLVPLIVRIAGATGWAEDDILAMRLDRLWQYRRAIDLADGAKPALAHSDRLMSEALAAYSEYLASTSSAPAAA